MSKDEFDLLLFFGIWLFGYFYLMDQMRKSLKREGITDTKYRLSKMRPMAAIWPLMIFMLIGILLSPRGRKNFIQFIREEQELTKRRKHNKHKDDV